MTAEFPHDFVQETLERLDSCHDGDFSRILLRMEYLDRIILNCGELADSSYRIGSAVACLPSKQGSGVIYRSNRSKCIGGQLVFLVDSEFTRPKTSELLETKKDKKKRWKCWCLCLRLTFLVCLHAQISVDCFRKSKFRY